MDTRSIAKLGAAVLVYVASSIGGVAAVKQLNYAFCFSLPWFLALACRTTFVWAWMLHIWLQARHGVKVGRSYRQMAIYAVIGLLFSLVEGLNMFSMTVLPGSWYALIKASEPTFNLLLSRLLLRKKVPFQHYLGVWLISCGVAASILGRESGGQEHVEAAAAAERHTGISRNLAAWLAVVAAFLTALTTVVTEGYLKHVKEEQVRLLKPCRAEETTSVPPLLLSNAFTLDTNCFAFLWLLPPFAWSGETRELGIAATSGCGGVELDRKMQGAFVLCILVASLARQSEKLSKTYICIEASSVFFSTIQSAQRLVRVVALALLFGEALSQSLLLGIALAIAGFGLLLPRRPARGLKVE